jgi:hypothetical protein
MSQSIDRFQNIELSELSASTVAFITLSTAYKATVLVEGSDSSILRSLSMLCNSFQAYQEGVYNM